MILDIVISLILTVAIGIAVKLWFGELGFSSFPTLTFLTVSIVSFFVTSASHALLHSMGWVP